MPAPGRGQPRGGKHLGHGFERYARVTARVGEFLEVALHPPQVAVIQELDAADVLHIVQGSNQRRISEARERLDVDGRALGTDDVFGSAGVFERNGQGVPEARAKPGSWRERKHQSQLRALIEGDDEIPPIESVVRCRPISQPNSEQLRFRGFPGWPPSLPQRA